MRREDQLIGRDGEIAAVTGALGAALGEAGGCLAVRGAAGAGKTALLGVAVERASAAGMTVLRASGVRPESHLPFGGLHQLLQFLREGIAKLPESGQASLRAAFEADQDGAPAFFGIALAVLELLVNAAAVAPIVEGV